MRGALTPACACFLEQGILQAVSALGEVGSTPYEVFIRSIQSCADGFRGARIFKRNGHNTKQRIAGQFALLVASYIIELFGTGYRRNGLLAR